jgi:hypothetical protein
LIVEPTFDGRRFESHSRRFGYGFEFTINNLCKDPNVNQDKVKNKKMIWQNILITSIDPQIELERRIDFIIKLFFRLYFNTFLKNLIKKNFDNVNIICNYLYAKQII